MTKHSLMHPAPSGSLFLLSTLLRPSGHIPLLFCGDMVTLLLHYPAWLVVGAAPAISFKNSHSILVVPHHFPKSLHSVPAFVSLPVA